MGRRLNDIVDGPNGWNDDVEYGHDENQSAAPPCYVVTHEPPAHLRLASRFRFVANGVAAAIDQARTTVGDKDVYLMGGANTIDQTLAARRSTSFASTSPLIVGGGRVCSTAQTQRRSSGGRSQSHRAPRTSPTRWSRTRRRLAGGDV
jgi:hypothetical protein